MNATSNSDGCPFCKSTKYTVVVWNAEIGYDPDLYKVMCKACKGYYFRIISSETLESLQNKMTDEDMLKQLTEAKHETTL